MVDKEYWNEFYQKGEVPQDCSTFAASVAAKVPKNLGSLFELGCGNGRDARFFAQQGIKTYACDIAEASITKLRKETNSENLKFIGGDFTRLATPLEEGLQFGTIYSRFTLHSIPVEGASRTLKWAFDNLKHGGLLFIEVRSIKDPMYGKGTVVAGERDAYINTHYRRFLRKDEVESELETLGFKLEFTQEADNLAVYKDDNPVVIRIHARKP